MKLNTRSGLLAATVMGGFAINGQTWEGVDPAYRADSGYRLGASAGDIGADHTGILYSVGSAMTLGNLHQATVRASADAGANWTTLDLYLEPGWTWAHYRGVASTPVGAPNGTLFVSGWAGDPGRQLWLVRRSVDQGLTWQTVDSPIYGAMGTSPSAGDVKVAPSGDVFACGVQGGGGSPFQWVVRKSGSGGDPGTWSSVASVGSVGSSEARAIAFAGGSVFVVGNTASAAPKGNSISDFWTVQRSMNGGLQWQTVDVYQESSSQSAGAEAIVVDNSGKIFVAGYARSVSKGKVANYWVIRRSADGGSSWVTEHKTANSDGSFLSPTGLAADMSGNVWVCGYGGGSGQLWIVRKRVLHANGVVDWPVSDSWSLGSGSRPNGITSAANGEIFATGRWVDPNDGENWWVTRKLSAQ
jgi:hypothetical protein